jgi:hypothetical protein
MRPGLIRARAFGRKTVQFLAILTLAASCGPLSRFEAVPVDVEQQAAVPNMRDIRFWGDGDAAQLTAMVAAGNAALEREMAHLTATGHQGTLPPVHALAISGGGENGAFGAGMLVGWTAAGTRPQFKIVTGISTGALTAPLAFLGPDYDDTLRAVYTTISAKDVFEPRGIYGMLFQDAMADTTPLRATVAKYFDQAMLDAIAEEDRNGRILLIGTTNLDSMRPVIWSIGAIANSGQPNRLKLVQDILVASAAIPGAFPPVMIDVSADGRTYQEMHVDGGATSQVFVYPPSLDLHASDAARGFTRERHLYVIRNARLDPNWAQVERSTMSIAGRAITALIQSQGLGDLYRIYLTSQRDDVDFKLAHIPRTFSGELAEPFDSNYMGELFQLGYDMAAQGYPWEEAPPGF